MTRKEIRNRQKILARENLKYGNEMVLVPEEKWPTVPGRKAKPIRVLRNKSYLVQVVEDKGRIRISVTRTQINNKGDWPDGITWDELQRIKSQIGLGNQLAIEVYPKDEDMVNMANIRHLWIIDSEKEIGWKS